MHVSFALQFHYVFYYVVAYFLKLTAVISHFIIGYLSLRSMFFYRESVNVDKLARNVKIIAEALARHMYNISGEALSAEIFSEGLVRKKLYIVVLFFYD